MTDPMTQETEKLAACPFCGDPMKAECRFKNAEGEIWMVMHTLNWRCWASNDKTFSTEAEAITAWNTRTPPTETADELARAFHETYERLAPQFGYETRADTKSFDPDSPNGKLMSAVCAEMQSRLTTKPDPTAPADDGLVERIAQFVEQWNGDTRDGDTVNIAFEIRQQFAALQGGSGDAVRETWESINQWCDDTFGPATVQQIIERAKEEWEELEAPGADHAIEAADVVICLCRIPGFADALQRKMAINRKRKWRTTGNGTGYHIPDAALSGNAGGSGA